MDKVWLHQLFGGYGQVDDIYIPLKISAKFNTKFGFIRFLKREEALNAVHALDGIVIRDFNQELYPLLLLLDLHRNQHSKSCVQGLSLAAKLLPDEDILVAGTRK
ncbi:hypothetical protein RHGRI_010165 [Rhododendron griersonianum]|uniref:RRM domain-containing protein n=1 Tax=Rhododendron griersonianum TaxID=479676 RepID=A0AAV6KIB0_9ERIC|nr:hypothetical protein RHGRI_010165 [Rhododendron griersonianum]